MGVTWIIGQERQDCVLPWSNRDVPALAEHNVLALRSNIGMSQSWSQTRGWLRAAFNRHQLLLVNCGVSVGLSGLGDLLQQRIEAGRQRGPTTMAIYRSPPTINWSRTANMSTSFGLTAGLLCHHWYRLLDNFLPGRTLRTIVVKIAWDQVLFSPICIAACIFVSGAVFEAKSSTQIMEDTTELGTQLWLSEWFIWPPAQFVNFYFLPTKYRVVYDNLVSLFYDWYTSHLKHSRTAVEELKGQDNMVLEDKILNLESESDHVESESMGLRQVL